MAKPRTEKIEPRDPEQLAADRARITEETDAGVAAWGEAVARSLPVPVKALTGEITVAPSVRQDENRGLAERLLDVRNMAEEHRKLALRDAGSLLQRMAQLEQQVTTMGARIDKECEGIQKTQRLLEDLLRAGGEQVRVAGEIGRKMTDQVKVLEELRAMASDPHEVIKPLQRSIAFLKGDVEALAKTVDHRFEQMPRGRSQPLETRSADEEPLAKLGAEIRKLKERLEALE